MSIFTSASGKSVYRGYDYFLKNKVANFVKISDIEYEALVQGSEEKPYKVHLNINKPKTSVCDCPFANGRRICKHMMAVYFTAFPDEAEDYKRQLEEYEAEEEQREQEFEELCEKVLDTIDNMSADDLKQVLSQFLFEGPEWQFERFVDEWVD